MRLFCVVALACVFFPIACKPPEPAPAVNRPADAPPQGKDLMGGKPVAAPAPAGGQRIPFEQAAKVAFAWDAKSSSVVGTLHLEPGFHAYGPGETTGKPIALEVTGAAWTVKEVKMPPAQKKDLGELGISFVLTGDVEVRAVLAPVTPGAPVTGKLLYQVCSETACDRPRSAPFNLTPG